MAVGRDAAQIRHLDKAKDMQVCSMTQYDPIIHLVPAAMAGGVMILNCKAGMQFAELCCTSVCLELASVGLGWATDTE